MRFILKKIMGKVFPNITNEDEKVIHALYSRNRFLSRSSTRSTAGGRGCLYVLFPFLDEFYKDNPEERIESYKRNSTYFACTYNVAPFIHALCYHLEKRRAAGEDVPANSINDIKMSLMGPMSGIGDPLFQNVLRMICVGITAGLAAEGNILAPILFLLLSSLTFYLSYAFFAYLGYTLGTSVVDKMISGGLMEKITKATSLLGLIMVGAVCASSVKIALNWVPILGGAEFDVQKQVLDAIMPGLLPLVTVFTIFALLRKKVSINKIIIGIFVLNIIMAFLGMY